MSPTKISASLTLPNNFYCLGFGASTGVGSAFCSGVGEVLLSLPLLEFKGLAFQVLGNLCHMCPNPGSYSIVFVYDHFPQPDFGCFWLYYYFDSCFAFGALGHWYSCFDCYFFDPSWIPAVGFFSAC